MKRAILLAAFMAAAAAAPGLAATAVTFNGGSGTLPSGATLFQDFESFAGGTPGASIGTNAFAFNDSSSGLAARPAFGSTGNFGAVQTGGSYAVNFAPTSLFSFIVGSLDTYNSLTLLYEGGASQQYQGGQIINDLVFPSGDQISGQSNGVVTYRVTSGPRLIGAVFNSSGNSFEFDNLSTAAVPEPAAWALLIGGFALTGATLRRRGRAVRALI